MDDFLSKAPVISHTPNIFNKNRMALIKDSFQYLVTMYNNNINHEGPSNHMNSYTMVGNPYQAPGSVHWGMFVKYIELMGTKEHQERYLERAKKFEIVGCYAQTEVGHGSDIRSLETTATYDITTK